MKAHINEKRYDIHLHGIKFIFETGPEEPDSDMYIDMLMKSGYRIKAEEQPAIQEYLINHISKKLRRSTLRRSTIPMPEPPKPEPPKQKPKGGKPDDKKIEMNDYSYITIPAGKNRIKNGVAFNKYAIANKFNKKEILEKGITKCKICGLKYFTFFGPQHYMGDYHMSV